LKLKYLITVLRTMKIPSLFGIMRDWQAFVRMHFIYAALESGLLEALSTPSSRNELIQKLNIKRSEIFDALLDVGISVKELAYKNGLYSIKGKRSGAITGNEGDMLAAMIQANITYYSSAYRNATDRMNGGPLGNDLEKMGSLVARFSKIGEPLIRHFITDIATGKNSMRILDVGCGSGVFLQSTFNANQNATGIGIDIDEVVVEQAKQNMENWGLSDKFRIIAGDIRVPHDGLEGPFNLITLYNIIYYFPLEERYELLRMLRSMLSLDGIIAIVMHLQSRGKDLGAANLNMVNCSLKGLTPLPDLDDITEQLKGSGFNQIKALRLIPRSTWYGITAGISNPRY
jgi:2-polyprenyl-3-methyl-5-hydroxy-6-metoxy-1,4-benzoquinol methylase